MNITCCYYCCRCVILIRSVLTDLGAEDGISKRDFNVGVDCGSLPPQLRVVLNSDVHVQISALPSPATRVALAPDSEAATTVNS